MTGGEPRVWSVVVGPDGHGVVRHALSVAAAADVAVVRSTAAGGAAVPSVRNADVVHLHFTDRLFGPDAATSGRVFGQLADALPARRVVTLHDVPEPAGTAHAGRRIEVYRQVARRADALVVCSEHERRRLRRIGVDRDASVIPLPIVTPTNTRPQDRARYPGVAVRSIGVLGFLYPGKGHDAVLEATAELAEDVEVVALGQVSVGHDDLLATLDATARRVGRRLTVSGHLDDTAMAVAMSVIAVPVVPASTTSASSSLCSWIAAGRRPLTAANGFTCEMASLAPDLLTLYRPGSPGEMCEAVLRALAEPASTWHGGAIPVPLRMESVAGRHRALYRRMAVGP